MPRYVDVEALSGEIGACLFDLNQRPQFGPGDDTCPTLLETIRHFPTADVAPVRHGRWITPVPGDGEVYCSECHNEPIYGSMYGVTLSKCCPWCGAIMDLTEESEGEYEDRLD